MLYSQAPLGALKMRFFYFDRFPQVNVIQFSFIYMAPKYILNSWCHFRLIIIFKFYVFSSRLMVES